MEGASLMKLERSYSVSYTRIRRIMALGAVHA